MCSESNWEWILNYSKSLLRTKCTKSIDTNRLIETLLCCLMLMTQTLTRLLPQWNKMQYLIKTEYLSFYTLAPSIWTFTFAKNVNVLLRKLYQRVTNRSFSSHAAQLFDARKQYVCRYIHTMLGLKYKAEAFLRPICHVTISSSTIRFKQRTSVIHFLVLR